MYIIKNNLPKWKPQTEFETRDEAVKCFWATYSRLKKGLPVSITLRNEIDKDARGSLKVELDGFYYYVELYKKCVSME